MHSPNGYHQKVSVPHSPRQNDAAANPRLVVCVIGVTFGGADGMDEGFAIMESLPSCDRSRCECSASYRRPCCTHRERERVVHTRKNRTTPATTGRMCCRP
jgi:hypothetical protein